MKRCVLLLLLAAVVGVSLLVPSLGLGQPKSGGSLVYGLHVDLQQIDPHRSYANIEGFVFTTFCDSLVEPSKTGEPKPGLAESWEVSDDLTQWTFHLKKGVKFHNGRELTAEDVVFNFNRIMDPKIASARSVFFTVVDSVEATDRYTVKFVLKKPLANFLSSFYERVGVQTPIIAPECVPEDGRVTHPIGTGPFEFVEWKPKDYLKVKKFSDYREEGLPYLDEVIFKPIPDDLTRLNALLAGDVDIAFGINLWDASKLLKNPREGVELAFTPLGSIWMCGFNSTKPPFNDLRVRQAVAYGIDKNEMLLGVFDGRGEVANQPFSKSSPWYADISDYNRDVEKAKALLKEAGYPDGLDVVLTATMDYPQMAKTAEVMQAQLKDIGMNVKLDLSDWGTMISKLAKGDFTFEVCGFDPYGDPDTPFRLFFLPEAVYGFLAPGYNNPELIKLVEEGARIKEFGSRKEIYTRASKILQEDLPWIFTNESYWAVGWRSHVKDFYPNNFIVVFPDEGGLQYVWLDK